MKTSQQIWSRRYKNARGRIIGNYDNWLEGWKNYLNGSGGHALDLGCGLGWDSKFLLNCGYKVKAVDFSSEAIEYCKDSFPEGDFRVYDIADTLDFPARSFDVVVASLSLHYFEKEVTNRIFRDVGRILKNKGIFMFRVNAIGDHNSGYSEGMIEWDTILVEGVKKQFFNKSMIVELLSGEFRIRDLELKETNRYGRQKKTYNCFAEKL